MTRKPERTQLGEIADQGIPGLPLSQTSDGNYVVSEVVPCVFLAGPASSALHNAERVRSLVIPECPFVNLPETHRSRWGEGRLTAEDMKKSVWARPERVSQVEFLEWSESNHLRHSKFAGLRGDKDPRTVGQEQAGEACVNVTQFSA